MESVPSAAFVLSDGKVFRNGLVVLLPGHPSYQSAAWDVTPRSRPMAGTPAPRAALQT